MTWTAMEELAAKVPLPDGYCYERFELLGWQLAGIIPGFDREMVKPGIVKRV